MAKTVSCGSNAKLWNTIAKLSRRKAVELLGIEIQNVPAVHPYLADCRLDQPRKATNERRFPRSRQAHDHENLARSDAQGYRSDGGDMATDREQLDSRGSRRIAKQRLGCEAKDLPEITTFNFSVLCHAFQLVRVL